MHLAMQHKCTDMQHKCNDMQHRCTYACVRGAQLLLFTSFYLRVMKVLLSGYVRRLPPKGSTLIQLNYGSGFSWVCRGMLCQCDHALMAGTSPLSAKVCIHINA